MFSVTECITTVFAGRMSVNGRLYMRGTGYV